MPTEHEKKQQKLKRLKEKKQVLEAMPIIQEWFHFDILPLSEKKRREAIWKDYYAHICDGTAYQLFRKQAQLFAKVFGKSDKESSQVLAEIRNNSAAARELLAQDFEEDMGKPPFRDPHEFYNNSYVGEYRAILAYLEENDTSMTKAHDFLK